MGDRYDFEFFRSELREPGILWVTLDRPERRNAITPQMHAELAPLFARIATDREVRVVVITGAGDKPLTRHAVHDLGQGRLFQQRDIGQLPDSQAFATIQRGKDTPFGDQEIGTPDLGVKLPARLMARPRQEIEQVIVDERAITDRLAAL